MSKGLGRFQKRIIDLMRQIQADSIDYSQLSRNLHHLEHPNEEKICPSFRKRFSRAIKALSKRGDIDRFPDPSTLRYQEPMRWEDVSS